MELFIYLFIMVIVGMLAGSMLTYAVLNRLYERDIALLREVIQTQKPVIGNTKKEEPKDISKTVGKAEIVTHLTPEQREKQKDKVLMQTEEEMDKLFKSVIQ